MQHTDDPSLYLWRFLREGLLMKLPHLIVSLYFQQFVLQTGFTSTGFISIATSFLSIFGNLILALRKWIKQRTMNDAKTWVDIEEKPHIDAYANSTCSLEPALVPAVEPAIELMSS